MKDTLNQDGFKTIRILDPPNTQIIAEQPCQQNNDGDCIVSGGISTLTNGSPCPEYPNGSVNLIKFLIARGKDSIQMKHLT